MTKDLPISDSLDELEMSTPHARGQRLRRLRNLANLSRKQCAELCQVNIHSLIGWENGRFGGLSRSGAQKILTALSNHGVVGNIEWLMDEVGSPPSLMQAKPHQAAAFEPHASASKELNAIRRELAIFCQLYPKALTLKLQDSLMAPYYHADDWLAGPALPREYWANYIGHSVLLEMHNGEILCRELIATTTQATCFHLMTKQHHSEQLLTDAPINRLAPILWHRRPYPSKLHKHDDQTSST